MNNCRKQNSHASRTRRGHARGWWLDGWMAWRQSGQVVWSLGGYVDWRLCCWVNKSSRTKNRWHIGRFFNQNLSRLPDPVHQEPWFTSSITNTHYDGFRHVGGQKSFGWRLMDGWILTAVNGHQLSSIINQFIKYHPYDLFDISSTINHQSSIINHQPSIIHLINHQP